MVLLNNIDQLERAYSKWLELDKEPFWAIGSCSFVFKHVHVPLTQQLTVDKSGFLPVINMPMPSTYPKEKMNAGLICTKNTIWVVFRNLKISLQEYLSDYLKSHYSYVSSKGVGLNQNDVMVKGKKVLGEIVIERGGQIYSGCFINLALDDEDKSVIVEGLKEDRNFYPDKIENIGGLENLIPGFDKNTFVGDLEGYLYFHSEVPEFKKCEVI